MYLTQGLRRAAQIGPLNESTVFRDRRRTWAETVDRVARVAGGLSEVGVAARRSGSDSGAQQRPVLRAHVCHPVAGRGHGADQHPACHARGGVHPAGFRCAGCCSSTAPWRRTLRCLSTGFRRSRRCSTLDDDAPPAGTRPYEELAAAPAIADAGAGGDTMAGAVLHRRHDGQVQGRDAQPQQSGVERDEHDRRHALRPGHDLSPFRARCSTLPTAARPSVSQPAAGATSSCRASMPTDCLQTMEQEKVTHAAYVPTMINMLVNHPKAGEFDPLEPQIHPVRRPRRCPRACCARRLRFSRTASSSTATA